MRFFSVIIPTYNRCNLLTDVIQAVRAQQYPDELFEIIVVDNASKDETRQVIERLNELPAKSVRYVFEARPGLHWARHAGARAALGDILIYTDDDAEPTAQWLSSLTAAYEDANVGAVGGPISVRWTTAPPEWVVPLGTFGHLDLGAAARNLTPPETINGANYSIRKDVLFSLGGFNPDTAVEDRLVGDGETGLCRKLYANGWKISYSPAALVYHVQEGAAVTLAGMRHRFAQAGKSSAVTEYKLHQHATPALLVRAAATAIRGLLLKVRSVLLAAAAGDSRYASDVNGSRLLAKAGYWARIAFDRKFRMFALREDWISEANDRSS